MMRNWKRRLAAFLAAMLLFDNVAMPISVAANESGENGIVEIVEYKENNEHTGLLSHENGNDEQGVPAVVLNEDVPDEYALGEQTPAKQIPGEQTPDEQIPGEQAPAEQISGEQTPGEQTPGEQTPGEQTPGEQTPGEQTPGEQTPNEQIPEEQTPSEQAPEEQTPSEQVPGEQTPDDNVPDEQVPEDTEELPEDIQVQNLSITASVTEAAVGDTVTFTAVLPEGMEPETMTWQWQLSADGFNWVDIDGAESYVYTTEISVVHLLNQLRVVAQPLQASGFSPRMRFTAPAPQQTYTSGTFQLTAAKAAGDIYWNPYGSPTFSEDGLIIVAAGNDNNDGSETAPFLSLTAAAAAAKTANKPIICMNLYGVYGSETVEGVTIQLYDGRDNVEGTAHTGHIFSVVQGVLTLNNVHLPGDPVVELAGGTLKLENGTNLEDYIYLSAPSQAVLPIYAASVNGAHDGKYIINFDPGHDGVVGIAPHIEGVSDEQLLSRFELHESLKARSWALYVNNGNVYAYIPPVYQAIYLDGVDGKDSNLGNDPTCPVRTFAQAKLLLEKYNLSEILVMNTVTLPTSGQNTYTLAQGKTVHRHPKCTGPMFLIQGADHTFEMAIDGRIAVYGDDNKLTFQDYSIALVQITGGTMKLAASSDLKNSTGYAITAQGGTVEIDGAAVSNVAGVISGTADVKLTNATLNANGSYAISVSGNVTSTDTTFSKPIQITGGNTASVTGGSVSNIESASGSLTVDKVGSLTAITGTGNVTVTDTAVTLNEITGKQVTVTSGTIGKITASSDVAVTAGTIDAITAGGNVTMAAGKVGTLESDGTVEITTGEVTKLTADGNVTIHAGTIGELTSKGEVTVKSGTITKLTSEGNVKITTATINELNTNGDVTVAGGTITSLNLNGKTSALITDGKASFTNITLAGPDALIRLSGELSYGINLTIRNGRNGRVVVQGEGGYDANLSAAKITHVKEAGDSFKLIANGNDIVMEAPQGIYVDTVNGHDVHTEYENCQAEALGLTADHPVKSFAKAAEIMNAHLSDSEFPRFIYVIGPAAVVSGDTLVTNQTVTVMSYDGTSSPMITVPAGVTFAPNRVNFDGAGVNTIFEVQGKLTLSNAKLSNANTGIHMSGSADVDVTGSGNIYANSIAIDMDGGDLNAQGGLYGPMALDMESGKAVLDSVRTNNSTYGNGTVDMASGELTVSGSSYLTTVTQHSGPVTVTGGSITTLNQTKGTVNVSGGYVSTLNKTDGTLNITGTASVSTLTHKAGTTNVSANPTSYSYGVSSLTMEKGDLTISGSGKVRYLNMKDGVTKVTGGSVSNFTQNNGQTTLSGGTVSSMSTYIGTTDITGGTVSNLYVYGTDGTVTVTATGGTITNTYLKATKSVLHNNGNATQSKVSFDGTGSYLALSGELKQTGKISTTFSTTSSNYHEGYSLVRPEGDFPDATTQLGKFQMSTEIVKRFNLAPGSGETATHIVLAFDGVFIDTQNGDDNAPGAGRSPTNPVRTFAKAKEVLKDAVAADSLFVRAIYIVDKNNTTQSATAIVGSETVDFSDVPNSYITPFASRCDLMMQVPAGVSFTLSNVKLSGNGNNGAANTSTVLSVSGSFTMTNGIINDGRKTVLQVNSGANVNLNSTTVTPHQDYRSSATTVAMTGGTLNLNSASVQYGTMGVDKTGGTLNLTGSASVTGASNTGIRNAGGSVTIGSGASVSGSRMTGLDLISGTATLDGGTISGNGYYSSYSNGIYPNSRGGVVISGGSFTMNSGTISGNRSAESGAGVAVKSGSFVMKSGTISSNYASQNGGGVYVADGASITMKPDTGKTITVTGNKAINGNGGGICAGTVDVTISALSSNTAGGNGGGASLTGGTLTVTGNVNSNTAGGNGGGVYMADGTLTVSGDVYSNTASQSGGGIWMQKGDLTTTGSIYGNTATNGNGGGIYEESGSVTASGSGKYIRNNKAQKGNGGAVYTAAGTLSVTGVTLGGSGNANIAKDGGAVWMGNGTFNLSNATVSYNQANAIETSGGNGGGIYGSAGAAITLEQVTVTQNTSSQDGAGVYLAQGASVTVVETSTATSFSNNTATRNGGGIYAASGSTLTIESATISSNKAVDGAGLYWNCGNANIAKAKVQNNVASGNGGGMYIVGNVVGHRHTFGNGVTISNNSAVNGAGIFNNCRGTLELNDAVTITNNTASKNGGGIFQNAGTLIVSHDLSNNSATQAGSTVYLEEEAEMNHVSGTIQGNVYAKGQYTITLPAAYTNGTITLVNSEHPLMIAPESTGVSAKTFNISLEAPAIFKGCIVIDGTSTSPASHVKSTGKTHFAIDLENIQNFTVGTSGYDVVADPSKDVYWDPRGGTYGNDSHSGESSRLAVKTFEKAKELLAAKGSNARIIMCGTLKEGGEFDGSVTGTGTYDGQSWNAKIVRCSADGAGTRMSNILFHATSALTFKNITISGEYEDGTKGSTCSTLISNQFGGPPSSVTITIGAGTVLTDNHSSSSAGAVKMLSGTLEINGATIDNCSAAENGGAVVMQAATLKISNAEISNCSAVNGGAIVADGTTVTISSSTFRNNKATGNGGVIYAPSSNITVTQTVGDEQSLFHGNSADLDGAVFYQTVSVESRAAPSGPSEGGTSSGTPTSLSVSGAKFTSNSTNLNYGKLLAQTVKDSTVTLTDCIIGNPDALAYPESADEALSSGGNAGAYMICNSGATILTRTYIDGNYATSCSVDVQKVTVGDSFNELVKCEIDNTSISYNYSSMAALNTASLDIKNNSKINGNSAYGARTFFQTMGDLPSICITDSEISHNGSSGVVSHAAAPESIKITNSTFEGNGEYGIVARCFSKDKEYFIGQGSKFLNNAVAGIQIYGGNATIDGVIVDGNGKNNATGRGIEVGSGDITITNTIISNNGSMANTEYGGGMYVENGAYVTMDSTVTFSGNEAKKGGAFYAKNSTLDDLIANVWDGKGVKLIDNKAQYGGALYVDKSINVTGFEMSENEATYGGAVSVAGNVEATIKDMTINGNQAEQGGAIYVDDKASAIVQNLTMQDNRANLGGAVYAAASTSDSATVKASRISGNTSTADGNLSSGIYSAGRVLFMHGGSVDIDDNIYLADNRYPITLTSTMHRGDLYNIALNMSGTNGFTYGDVVVEPNKNGALPKNASQYLNYVAPVNAGVVFSKRENCIVLKRCVFVDGVSGSDNNSGATPLEAYKTVEQALQSGIPNLVVYICGEVTVNGTVTWNPAQGVELHRYTGFAIGGDKAYPAYYGDMIHVAKGGNLTIDGGIERIQGWHATGDTIIPRGDLILVDGTLNITGTTELEGNMTETVNGGGIRNTGTVNVKSGATLKVLDVSGANGGAIHNSGTFAVDGTLEISNAQAANGGAIYNTGTFTVSGTLTATDVSASANGGAVYQAGEFTVNNGATMNLGTAPIYLTNDAYLSVGQNATVNKPAIEIGDARDGRIYVHYLDKTAAADDHLNFALSNSVKNSFQLAQDQENLILTLSNIVYVNAEYNGLEQSGKERGKSPDYPFTTLAEAYTELNRLGGGMIYLVSAIPINQDVTVGAKIYQAGSTTINLGSTGVSIRRYSKPDAANLNATNKDDFDAATYTGPLFTVTNGTLKLDGILVDGHGKAVTSAGEDTRFTIADAVVTDSYMVELSGTGKVDITNGASLINNGDSANDRLYAVHHSGSTVTISGTTANTVGGTVMLDTGKVINVDGTVLPSNPIRVELEDVSEGRVIADYSGTIEAAEAGKYILDDSVLELYMLTNQDDKVILTAKGAAYVDGVNGADSASRGTTPSDPLKTLEQAYKNLAAQGGGIICIVNTVTIPAGTDMYLAEDRYISGAVEHTVNEGTVRIMRYSKPTANVTGFNVDSFTGTMISVAKNAKLTLENIVLDGHSNANTGNDKTTAGAVAAVAPMISNQGSLLLENGTVLQNNNNTDKLVGGGAVSSTGANSTLLAAGVTITGNSASYGPGIFFTGTMQVEGKPNLAADQWVYPALESNYISVTGELASNVRIPVALPDQAYANQHVVAKYDSTLTPNAVNFTLENPKGVMETRGLSKEVKGQDVYLKQVFLITYPDPVTNHLQKTENAPNGADPYTEVITWIEVTDDDYVLPGTIRVVVTTVDGTARELTEGEHYTYDSDTGEIIIDEDSVNGRIEIQGDAVKKLIVTYPTMADDHMGKVEGQPDKANPYDGVADGENFETKIEADDSYTLPDEITITVGGETLTQGEDLESGDYTYDPETGKIVIKEEKLTGDVVISGKAEPYATITYVLENLAKGDNAPTSTPKRARVVTTIKLAPGAGSNYHLPNTITVSVDGTVLESGYSYSPTSGQINIPAHMVTGDIVITAKATGKIHIEYPTVGLEKGDPAPETAFPFYDDGNDVDLNLDINPKAEYTLPDEITIKVNGAELDADAYTYDPETGNITIYEKNITGDIKIEAEGVPYAKVYYELGENLQPGTGAKNSTPRNQAFSTSIAVIDAQEYRLPDTIQVAVVNEYGTTVTLNAVTDYTYDKDTGSIDIAAAKVTGDITITAEAVGKLTVTYPNEATDHLKQGQNTENKVFPDDKDGNEESFRTSIEPAANHALPQTITITVGDKTLTAVTDYTYDPTSGEIVIFEKNLTGNIKISGQGIPIYSVTYDLKNLKEITDAPKTVLRNQKLETGIQLMDSENFRMPDSITVTVGGTTLTGGYTYSKADGSIVINADQVIGDIVIKAEAVGKITVIYPDENNDHLKQVNGTANSVFPDDNDNVDDHFNTRIEPADGYALPGSITVTVGGKTLNAGADYSYNSTNGEITIYERNLVAPGPIVISGTGIPVYSVTYELGEHLTKDTNAPTSVVQGNGVTATLTAATGYQLPNKITVTVGGEELTEDNGYTYDPKTGAISIDANVINGHIVITAAAAEKISITYPTEGLKPGNGSPVETFPFYDDGETKNLNLDIDPQINFALPETITVKVGNTVLQPGTSLVDGDYTYDATTGTIVIREDKLTGPVVIDATGIPIYNITYSLANLGQGTNAPTKVNDGSGVTTSIVVNNTAEYRLPDSITVKVNGTALTSGYTYTKDADNSAVGHITIIGEKVKGHIEIIAVATGRIPINYPDMDTAHMGKANGELDSVFPSDGNGPQGDLTTKIVAAANYTLPQTITITVNSTTLIQGTDYTYNPATGDITIYERNLIAPGPIVISGQAIPVYKVEYVLSHLAQSENAPSTVVQGNAVNVTITADTNHQLPNQITVTVGGTALATTAYSYTPGTGEIQIPANVINGNIVITAAAQSKLGITYPGSGLQKGENSPADTFPFYDDGQDTDLTLTIVAKNGYALPESIESVKVKVNGTELENGYSYDPKTGTIVIQEEKLTGDIEIVAEGIPIYNITYVLTNLQDITTPVTVLRNHAVEAVLKVESSDNYRLPDSIKVAVAGSNGAKTELTAGTDYTYTKADGKIVINADAVTGDITITAEATGKLPITYPNKTEDGLGKAENQPDAVFPDDGNGTNDHNLVTKIEAADGYILPDQITIKVDIPDDQVPENAGTQYKKDGDGNWWKILTEGEDINDEGCDYTYDSEGNIVIKEENLVGSIVIEASGVPVVNVTYDLTHLQMGDNAKIITPKDQTLTTTIKAGAGTLPDTITVQVKDTTVTGDWRTLTASTDYTYTKDDTTGVGTIVVKDTEVTDDIKIIAEGIVNFDAAFTAELTAVDNANRLTASQSKSAEVDLTGKVDVSRLKGKTFKVTSITTENGIELVNSISSDNKIGWGSNKANKTFVIRAGDTALVQNVEITFPENTDGKLNLVIDNANAITEAGVAGKVTIMLESDIQDQIALEITISRVASQINVTVPLVLVMKTDIDGGEATLADDQYKITNNSSMNVKLSGVQVQQTQNTTANPNPMTYVTGSVAGLINRFSINFNSGYLGKVISAAGGVYNPIASVMTSALDFVTKPEQNFGVHIATILYTISIPE